MKLKHLEMNPKFPLKIIPTNEFILNIEKELDLSSISTRLDPIFMA